MDINVLNVITGIIWMGFGSLCAIDVLKARKMKEKNYELNYYRNMLLLTSFFLGFTFLGLGFFG